MAYTYLDPSTINIITGSYNIRAIDINGENYFVLLDLAKYLGYVNSNDLLRLLDNSEVAIKHNVLDWSGRSFPMTLIPERALDEICLKIRANRPEIDQFRTYVLNIIGQVRATGMYIPPDILARMNNDPEVSQWFVNQTKSYYDKMQILEAQRKEAENRQRLELMYRTFSDKWHALQNQRNAALITVAKGIVGDISRSIDIGELAKHIWNTDTDIGRNRLFALLRKDGYLLKSVQQYNIPSQDALDRGYLILSEVNYPKTFVTPKGIIHFVEKYKDINLNDESSSS